MPGYPADTTWLMVSAAMVLLMTPGLAFFYGGMVRTTHVLVMLRMIFACLGVVTIIWFLFGYSLAFSGDAGGVGLIGDFSHSLLVGISPNQLTGRIPTVVYAVFQMAFAIITVALICGSIASRARYDAWIVFVVVWSIIVYIPLAHWVFSPNGWLVHKLGVLDFAGGTVVEMNSGAAGLAVALVLRDPPDFRRAAPRPHSLPLVGIGLALLWFGWFGFNAGSALQAAGAAPLAFINTQLGAASAMVGWVIADRLRFGKVNMIGVLTSAVAGMVAITPACGEVNPVGAVVIGLLAGAVCSFAIGFKHRLNVDDTLDVVGIHGWGGVVGMLLIGLFSTGTFTGKKGLVYGGGLALLGKQAIAIVVTLVFSFVLTWIIAKVIDRTMGFRTPAAYVDVPGGDDERAYAFGTVTELRKVMEAGPRAGERGVTDAELVARIRSLIEQRDQES